jgi:Ca2+-binding EF-hand superfamily protein
LFLKEYKLRLLFDQYDKEKAGTITLNQLREIIESKEINLSSEQLDRIFKNELGVDLTQIDNNDVISYNLFISCLRKEFKIE